MLRLIVQSFSTTMYLVCLLIRSHKESALAAERVGELVRSLGVEHQILEIEWPKKKGRAGVLEVRQQRILFCQRMNIGTLMVASHLDYEIGKQCLRCSENSGWVS